MEEVMRIANVDLIKELSDKIKDLPDDNIQEVMDFIEFLRSKKRKAQKGSPELMLKHVGSWKFEKGELDNILGDIQKLREIEE